MLLVRRARPSVDPNIWINRLKYSVLQLGGLYPYLHPSSGAKKKAEEIVRNTPDAFPTLQFENPNNSNVHRTTTGQLHLLTIVVQIVVTKHIHYSRRLIADTLERDGTAEKRPCPSLCPCVYVVNPT